MKSYVFEKSLNFASVSNIFIYSIFFIISVVKGLVARRIKKIEQVCGNCIG